MTRLIYAFFLILFIISAALDAQDKNCHYCNKPIVNAEYIKAGDYYFHPDHFRCSNCDEVIKESFYQRGSLFYHPNCYQNQISEKCAYCGKPLTEQYIKFENKSYHKDCYTQHVAMRCDLCNNLINGLYYEDYWGNIYHQSHKKELSECNYCGRLISEEISEGGYKYEDGRAICGICKPLAIMDKSSAKGIMLDVKKSLEQKGIFIGWDDIGLTLVDKNGLAENARSHIASADMRGFANQTKTTRNGKLIDQDFHIYILYGMPEQTFRMVAAHELMHVWQYLEAPEDNDPYFKEGSCEFAAYLIANEGSDKFSDYLVNSIETNQKKVYREGFKRVRKLVAHKGINGWLNFLRHRKTFPTGY